MYILIAYPVIYHLDAFYSDKNIAAHFSTVISKPFYPYEVYPAITLHTIHSSYFMSSAMLHSS